MLCENIVIHPFNGIVLHVACLKLICLASPYATWTLSPEAMNTHELPFLNSLVSNLPDFDEIIHIIANQQDHDFRASIPRLSISELPPHAFSPFWEMCHKLRNQVLNRQFLGGKKKVLMVLFLQDMSNVTANTNMSMLDSTRKGGRGAYIQAEVVGYFYLTEKEIIYLPPLFVKNIRKD